MPRFPRLQASFVLLLVLESACESRRVSVPVPSPPTNNAPAEQPPPPAANNSQPPSPAPTTTHAQESVPYQVNKPPQPAPAAKKPARSATPPTAPAQTAATPSAPPAPPPKLGDVLTADEQRQYTTAIDQSLSRAQTSLNAVGARQLSTDQQAEVEQIRNFIKQAQGTRSSDPPGAKSLAERAEVLARDLAASFH
ncbi:MAG: hypothetical protein ABSG13_26230 [Bryobacteraceae bacterium]